MSQATTDQHIEFTPEALTSIRMMIDRARLVGDHYGTGSQEFGRVADSLLSSLCNMLRLGGRIRAEGNLELLCITEHLVYGVNFHLDRDGDGDEGRHNLLGVWSVNS